MQSELTNDDNDAIAILAAGLRPFSQLSTTMPVSMVNAFLLVAKKGDRTTGELAKAAGTSLSKMSRHLGDLSAAGRYDTAGLGLVEQKIGLQDQRLVRCSVTERG